MKLTKAQKVLLGFILVVCLVLAALTIIYLNKRNSETTGGSIIFFYGAACPHCKDVEDYMQEKNIKSKLQIDELEVTQNPDNLAKMREYAIKCGFTGDTLMTPFVYFGGRCYMGEDDVVNFLKIRAGGL